MTTNISKITVLSLLAAGLVILPCSSRAQDATPNAPAGSGETAPAKPKKHNPPFHGKLSAVDTNAMTFTVGKMTLHVTSDTKIIKSGNPATLTDGVVGEPVSGTYKKTEDGKLDAITVHFGAKAEKSKPESSDAGDKATGN